MVQYDPAPNPNRVPFGSSGDSGRDLIFSFNIDITRRGELKSCYVMTDDKSWNRLTEAFDLQIAFTTATGDLYRNAGISCAD